MGERDRELLLLVFGDALFLLFSLWITLSLRYLSFPSQELFSEHLGPFLIISAVWLIVFYIGGLYDKHTSLFKSLLFSRIVNIQLLNVAIAALLFLVIPFGIAPKTNLVIYLFVSVTFITLWRAFLFSRVGPSTQHKAMLIADGPDAVELADEINNNDRYNYYFVRLVDRDTATSTEEFTKKVLELINKEQIRVIVADPSSDYVSEILPNLFDMSFIQFKLTFINFHQLYEDTFDKVALSALQYDWVITNVSQVKRIPYEFGKRIIDVVGSTILGMILAVLLPIIWLAIKYEDRGSIFISQERVGKYNVPIKIWKIRTMTENRTASATWVGEDKEEGNKITKVGAVLRKLSIDELPQVLSIFVGEMSLIGPRNDISGLAERLAEEIPYYNVRNMVKPGVTGWAQTHQRYMGNNISPQSVLESKERLAYDLFYVKNRSLVLDMAIALKTVKTLLSRFGTTIRFKK